MIWDSSDFGKVIERCHRREQKLISPYFFVPYPPMGNTVIVGFRNPSLMGKARARPWRSFNSPTMRHTDTLAIIAHPGQFRLVRCQKTLDSIVLRRNRGISLILFSRCLGHKIGHSKRGSTHGHRTTTVPALHSSQ